MIHKDYTSIPSFYSYGSLWCWKVLVKYPQPLTLNEYSLKDSFEATQRIYSVPTKLFAQGYRYVSFDVVSLFTNVPLKKTIEIIFKRVYNDQLVQTKLKKRTLKKTPVRCMSKDSFFLYR